MEIFKVTDQLDIDFSAPETATLMDMTTTVIFGGQFESGLMTIMNYTGIQPPTKDVPTISLLQNGGHYTFAQYLSSQKKHKASAGAPKKPKPKKQRSQCEMVNFIVPEQSKFDIFPLNV